MNHLGDVLGLVYGLACICVAVYLVILARRFVRAHERLADALGKIAGSRQTP